MCRMNCWITLLFAVGSLKCVQSRPDPTNVRLLEAKNSVYSIKQKEDFKWDHFVYTQQWPPTICINTHDHICVIPKNVTTWTVHGLWPSQGSEMAPFNCNNSWPFDKNQINSLVGELWEHWPNLYVTSDKYEFWEHEWVKHGTCAASKPELNSEYKYFKKGLDLQHSVDVASVLKQGGFEPSNSSVYQIAKVNETLQGYFGKNSIVLECEYVNEQQYLKQVEVCLDKSTYKSITCPKKSREMRPTSAASERKNENYWRSKAELVGKCVGDPNFCECIDTVVIPQYYHP